MAALRSYLRRMLTHASFLLTGATHGRPFEADATYQATGHAQPVLLFVHGFKGFKDWGTSRCWPIISRRRVLFL